ncbi:hypothetical protein JXQ31_13580 [candidate division KSB1 bacterium]|nr:hypothetical protein [candidate division KSB1 bacterium]
MKKIKILINKISLTAELRDTPTANQIYDALPIAANVNTWGDEIYCSTIVKAYLEPNASEELKIGEIGYWPPCNAFCIFFGPTPASIDDKPRAASAVNIIGIIHGDTAVFRSVNDGDKLRIEKENK